MSHRGSSGQLLIANGARLSATSVSTLYVAFNLRITHRRQRAEINRGNPELAKCERTCVGLDLFDSAHRDPSVSMACTPRRASKPITSASSIGKGGAGWSFSSKPTSEMPSSFPDRATWTISRLAYVRNPIQTSSYFCGVHLFFEGVYLGWVLIMACAAPRSQSMHTGNRSLRPNPGLFWSIVPSTHAHRIYSGGTLVFSVRVGGLPSADSHGRKGSSLGSCEFYRSVWEDRARAGPFHMVPRC